MMTRLFRGPAVRMVLIFFFLVASRSRVDRYMRRSRDCRLREPLFRAADLSMIGRAFVREIHVYTESRELLRNGSIVLRRDGQPGEKQYRVSSSQTKMNATGRGLSTLQPSPLAKKSLTNCFLSFLPCILLVSFVREILPTQTTKFLLYPDHFVDHVHTHNLLPDARSVLMGLKLPVRVAVRQFSRILFCTTARRVGAKR